MERYSIDGRLVPTLNGGAGSGNFGHAGRPGKVGGSAPSSMGGVVSSAMRSKRFMKGDIVRATTPDGDTIEGTYDRVEGKITVHDAYIGFDYEAREAIRGDREVTAAIVIDKDGQEHKVPFYGDYFKMVRNVDAPETTPEERRTEKQQKALDSVFSMVKVSPSEQKWFKANCSEDTAVALDKALKDAKADGVDVSEIALSHNGRLKSAQARVTYGTTSQLARLDLELSNETVFDGEYFNKKQKNQYEEGWHTSPTLEGIVRHELGHTKQAQIIIKASKQKGEWISAGRLQNELRSFSNTIIEQATGKSFYTLDYGKGKDISKYGVIDGKPCEVIAESYSNPDFSSATRKIVAKLDEYAKTGYNYNMVNDKVNNRIQVEPNNSLCTGYPMSEEDWEILHGLREEHHDELEG